MLTDFSYALTPIRESLTVITPKHFGSSEVRLSRSTAQLVPQRGH
jgi:hypothetical protein